MLLFLIMSVLVLHTGIPVFSLDINGYFMFFFPRFSDEFQMFASSHPEYAKLFTTYLELQRYQACQEAMPGDLELAGQIRKGEATEDSISDKKDD